MIRRALDWAGRRNWWVFCFNGWLARRRAAMKSETHCDSCGTELTAEEATYYEDQCEQCVRAWQARIQAWREGGEDRALDALYGASPMKRASP